MKRRLILGPLDVEGGPTKFLRIAAYSGVSLPLTDPLPERVEDLLPLVQQLIRNHESRLAGLLLCLKQGTIEIVTDNDGRLIEVAFVYQEPGEVGEERVQ